MLQLLLAVFIGGGTGSVARWLLSMRFNPLHQAIPLGTLAANLIGAFIIGMGFAWFSRMTNIDPVWKVSVSYTHLDVYKRQKYHRKPDTIFT